MNVSSWTKAALASAMLSAFVACGGGGGGDSTTVATPTPTPTPTPTVTPGTTPTGTSLRALAESVATTQSREFVFGTAAEANYLGNSYYSTILPREFNALVAENAMKFASIEKAQNTFSWTDPDQLVTFAKDHGMTMRGHTMVWHTDQGVPTWLRNISDPADVDAALKNHIYNVMDHFKGSPIKSWDVVNEAINDNPDISDISNTSNTAIDSYLRKGSGSFWYSKLGSACIAKAFQYAHERAVLNGDNIKLFYNDYGCEGLGNNKFEALYDLVKKLQASNVPIDGVGFQMHIDTSGWPSVNDVTANIKKLTDLGLEVHITELDVRIPTNPTSTQLDAQKRIYHDIIAACPANPKVTAIMVWGFTDNYSWIPNTFPGTGSALLFDTNYNAKPAYYGVQDALGLK
jgi:endo-1,4-beta-xylanase